MVRPTVSHSAAACLHVPAGLTRESTKHEGRKPRASERHAVGCCEELGGPPPLLSFIPRCSCDKRYRCYGYSGEYYSSGLYGQLNAAMAPCQTR